MAGLARRGPACGPAMGRAGGVATITRLVNKGLCSLSFFFPPPTCVPPIRGQEAGCASDLHLPARRPANTRRAASSCLNSVPVLCTPVYSVLCRLGCCRGCIQSQSGPRRKLVVMGKVMRSEVGFDGTTLVECVIGQPHSTARRGSGDGFNQCCLDWREVLGCHGHAREVGRKVGNQFRPGK